MMQDVSFRQPAARDRQDRDAGTDVVTGAPITDLKQLLPRFSGIRMVDLNSQVNHPVNNRCARMLENLGHRVDPRTLAALDLMLLVLEEGKHGLIYPHQVELQKEFLINLMDVEPERALRALGLVGDEVAVTPGQGKQAKTPEQLAQLLIWKLHFRLLELMPEYAAV